MVIGKFIESIYFYLYKTNGEVHLVECPIKDDEDSYYQSILNLKMLIKEIKKKKKYNELYDLEYIKVIPVFYIEKQN